ncbi:putative membrane protein [Winogradskyella pacifica]|uniref:Putative membrane protein n=2 Tax=Winogradskyella pacifica TaxID=664642 RepID=A0A3D9MX84_9FLAO|nr:putative membrane protein [Winogradskyella pacifica]
MVWLAFLPNAPYIVTDLIHIRIGNDSLLWLDVLVVLSFALSGLLLFYVSIMDMQKLVTSQFKKLSIKAMSISIIFLCGFGVYLGRFLRYNSWEIISGPYYLFMDIITIIMSPFQHFEAWLFTLDFGTFLVIGFWMFKNLNQLEKN